MYDNHLNEPREVGYSKEHKETYKEWIKKDSRSIFSGLTQADVFFCAMSIGYHRDKFSEPQNKASDIPVSVFNEEQKWGILSTEIIKNKDLSVLKDEKPIYLTAEKYAEEGIKIIKSHIEKYGLDYPKYLETELIEILEG